MNFKMITMKDNDISKYYTKRSVSSWRDHGYTVDLVDAVTPKTLNNQSFKLKFSEYSHASKYLRRQIFKPFSPTEKSVIYSYFNILKEAYDNNSDVLILEHDAVLIDPKRFEELYSKRKDYELMLFGLAVEATWFSAKFVRMLVQIHMTAKKEFLVGPMGTFVDLYHYLSREEDLKHLFLGHKHPSLCVKQLYNPDIGTTIVHYEDEKHNDIFAKMDQKVKSNMMIIKD